LAGIAAPQRRHIDQRDASPCQPWGGKIHLAEKSTDVVTFPTSSPAHLIFYQEQLMTNANNPLEPRKIRSVQHVRAHQIALSPSLSRGNSIMIQAFKLARNVRRATPKLAPGKWKLAALAALACCTAAASAAQDNPQYTAALDPIIVPAPLRGGLTPNQLIAIQISEALGADPVFRGTHYPVTIAVDNGKVLLRGVVYNERSRAHVAALAQSVPGVQRVVNEIHTVSVDN
jgi:hypothetical protein